LPHEKSENPGIELEPEEMQALIDKDRKTFESLAHELHDKVMIAFNAIEKRDKDALLDSGFGIDEACESCHVRYWYPNEAQNQEQYRQAPPPPGK
jgi:cytochrome c556